MAEGKNGSTPEVSLTVRKITRPRSENIEHALAARWATGSHPRIVNRHRHLLAAECVHEQPSIV
jgi:hypothetical protein